MSFNSIYINIANNFNNAIVEPQRADNYISDAQITIINVTTNEENAREITRTLLMPINKAYKYTKVYWQKEVYYRLVATEINEYVIKYINSDIAVYVNSLAWDDGCIPREWAFLSEDAGYNISEWNICSIS